MEGGIGVAYDRGSPRSDNFGEGLYLKDGLESSTRLSRVVQAATLPVRVKFSRGSDDGGPPVITEGMMRSVARPIYGSGNPKELVFEYMGSPCNRICDLCETLLNSQRGWHCNTCDDFDMCEACFSNSSENSDAQLPFPHQSDHPMSVFEAHDPTENTGILMPYVDGEAEIIWGYVVNEYPTARWSETFEEFVS